MQETFETIRANLVSRLKQEGIDVEPSALGPLRRISFTKLVAIHDHEEAFLKDVFIASLVAVYRARARQFAQDPGVNSHDVRAALRMLGAAATSVDENTFSRVNGTLIRDICPYCSRKRG